MASTPLKHNKKIEESDFNMLIRVISKNYKLILSCITVALFVAWLINLFWVPKFQISSSLLLTEDTRNTDRNTNEYLQSDLVQVNQNLQNELWILKSAPIIEQTVMNLNLIVNYTKKSGVRYHDIYDEVPFKIELLPGHVQPIDTKFNITLWGNSSIEISAKGKNIKITDPYSDGPADIKKNWKFKRFCRSGELIKTSDLAFRVTLDPNKKQRIIKNTRYNFSFSESAKVAERIDKNLTLKIVDENSTIIKIQYQTLSIKKGKDIVNELINVYSQQKLDIKNQMANTTINYINKQLTEISDSLFNSEDSLQRFRSYHQILDITEQTGDLTSEYMNLKNQQDELLARKRYYDYLADYLENNEDFSDMMVPASMGISDRLLTNLMSDLMTAHTQHSNLISNNQGQNPHVAKLEIQIANIKKTISNNITAVRNTMDISINEMRNRIKKTEAKIKKLPATQIQLGSIERKHKLNDAIYNYLLGKRAEAKITQASNRPDNVILESANLKGTHPVSPKKLLNYMIALFFGFTVPLIYLAVKNSLTGKIISQDSIEKITNIPVLGKIIHHKHQNSDTSVEHKSFVLTESFRTLRTNIELRFKNLTHKVIMVTSCIEGEGKSFNAINLAISYSQLGYRTLVVDYDLRKKTNYFEVKKQNSGGLYAWYTEDIKLKDVVIPSPYENLDIIQSGFLPSDPTYFLKVYNTGEKINELKSIYNCIILDTSPLAQFSDAYLLMQYADIKLFITRYNYSLSKVFFNVTKDLISKKIDNLFVVINDNKTENEQYGYGYGYGNKQEYKKTTVYF